MMRNQPRMVTPKTTLLLIWILFLSTAGISVFAQSTITVPVTEYDAKNSEKSSWEPMVLKGSDYTEYELVNKKDKQPYIVSKSNNAGSGLVYKVDIDPMEYPIMSWRWKISNVLEKGDLTQKTGDDYTARIYVIFDYDPKDLSLSEKIKYLAASTFSGKDTILRAINYIWANKAEKGTVAPNAYTKWSQLHVLQSGNEKAGMWISESQNIVEDYNKSFGENPPRISAIAIMTDTDSTHEMAMGYFSNIIFSKKQGQATLGR